MNSYRRLFLLRKRPEGLFINGKVKKALLQRSPTTINIVHHQNDDKSYEKYENKEFRGTWHVNNRNLTKEIVKCNNKDSERKIACQNPWESLKRMRSSRPKLWATTVWVSSSK